MTIASEITRIQNAKSAIKEAIMAKGVSVGDSVKISGYAELIGQIQTGGGASVPVLPDKLMVAAQKTSAENTPDYTGIYIKQNSPSDWTDTYYIKPAGIMYDDWHNEYPVLARYLCCVAGQGEYSWIITAYNPESQNINPLDGIDLTSVVSEVPVAPQDIRWENDTVNDEQVIVIVEEAYKTLTVLFDNNSSDIFSGKYTWNSSANRYEKQSSLNGDTVVCKITQRSNCWELERSDVEGNEIEYSTNGGVESIIGTHDWTGLGAFYSGTYSITIQ